MLKLLFLLAAPTTPVADESLELPVLPVLAIGAGAVAGFCFFQATQTAEATEQGRPEMWEENHIWSAATLLAGAASLTAAGLAVWWDPDDVVVAPVPGGLGLGGVF